MKAIDLTTIWERPKYLPYVQPALTDDIILAAESKIGYRLPKEYIELLKMQNGGYIRFTLKDTSHSQIYGIGQYYPSITSFEWLNDYEGTLSFKLEGLFPFDGDGHWSICLDYRKNKTEPEITSIDTESDFEKPIAKSFKEYLSILEIETNDEFVIDNVLSIDRYDDLKSQMEITSVRYPEISENALLINVLDDKVRHLLIDNLITKGLMIRQLKYYI